MTAEQPPYQLELDLPMPGRGEAPRRDAQEVEAVMATGDPESPASTKHLMEAICAPDNIGAALSAVVRNKGAPGIDGVTVKQLPSILRALPEKTESGGIPLRGRIGFKIPTGREASMGWGSHIRRICVYA